MKNSTAASSFSTICLCGALIFGIHYTLPVSLNPRNVLNGIENSYEKLLIKSNFLWTVSVCHATYETPCIVVN